MENFVVIYQNGSSVAFAEFTDFFEARNFQWEQLKEGNGPILCEVKENRLVAETEL